MSHNHVVTTGIVLSRTNFQEADRILTMLTPNHGKVRVIAKGVRKNGSKLAGGIELFSVSDITLLPGRGELQTLISSRLKVHYGTIVKDINRTMQGYELLKRLNRATEDATETGYFHLLNHALAGLNEPRLSMDLVDLWFGMQLLRITGHAPNLVTDAAGAKLVADQQYTFSFEEMAFASKPDGPYNARHIKLLRLAHATEKPDVLRHIQDVTDAVTEAVKIVSTLCQHSIRV